MNCQVLENIKIDRKVLGVNTEHGLKVVYEWMAGVEVVIFENKWFKDK